jgi:hypothetical protein
MKQEWCQGCDEVTFSNYMKWSDAGTYRCLHCLEGVAVPKADWEFRTGVSKTGRFWDAWFPPEGSDEKPIFTQPSDPLLEYLQNLFQRA